jgi:hypothetical protein
MLVRIHNPIHGPPAQDDAPAVRVDAALESLEEQRVAILYNGWPMWQVMLDELVRTLHERHPSAQVKQYSIPRGSAAAPEVLDAVAAESDCAIVGLGNCGSCTAWSYHDSVELMKAGVPTVWVITKEFQSLADAVRGARPAELPTITLPVNPETGSREDALALMGTTIPAILGSLTAPAADGGSASAAVAGRAPDRHVDAPEEAGDCFDFMYARGWTDGLPVIPPTEARVDRMLAALGDVDRDEVLATLPPQYGRVTPENIATNAVMAGCRPEDMPLLVAQTLAAATPDFNLNGIATTTASSTPLTIVNGPVRTALGINCERGMMGPGRRGNATIGRALRLLMLNVGGAEPGTVSKSVHGQPGRYTLCFGEHEEQSPWAPLHVDRGLAAGDSAVTLFGVLGTTNVMTERRDWRGMLAALGDSLAFIGSNNVLMGRGSVVVVLTPGHARVLDAAGLSKADVQQEIWQYARLPRSRFPETVRPQPPNVWLEDGDDILVVKRPENVLLVVAGGPEAHYATVMPTHPSVVPVTREVAGG